MDQIMEKLWLTNIQAPKNAHACEPVSIASFYEKQNIIN